jgi:hypothetical protein
MLDVLTVQEKCTDARTSLANSTGTSKGILSMQCAFVIVIVYIT